mgnify:CR=1 FL=1
MTDSAAGSGRDSVLAALREAVEPQTVTQLSETVGLHPNTVRGHLDALLGGPDSMLLEKAADVGHGLFRQLDSLIVD